MWYYNNVKFCFAYYSTTNFHCNHFPKKKIINFFAICKVLLNESQENSMKTNEWSKNTNEWMKVQDKLLQKYNKYNNITKPLANEECY